jgi:hypothetical protein
MLAERGGLTTRRALHASRLCTLTLFRLCLRGSGEVPRNASRQTGMTPGTTNFCVNAG